MQVITPELINSRYDKLAAEISEICARKGRKDNVKIIAVTKYLFPSQMEMLEQTKITDIGENRVRDAAMKHEMLHSTNFVWHMIGHLQSNKARDAARIFDVIHSIDSNVLASKLQSYLSEQGRIIKGLIEVNVFNEPQKQGIPADSAKELVDFTKASCPNIELTGLMCMAPYDADDALLRRGFSRLAELASKLELDELSMGMTSDYKIAVECGATMIRIGRYFWE